MEERISSHKFAPLLDNETSLDKESFNNLLDELLSFIQEQCATQPSLYQSNSDSTDENDPFWEQIIEKVREIIPLKQIKSPVTMKSACQILYNFFKPNQENRKDFTDIFSADMSKNYMSTSSNSLLQIRRTYLLMLIGHPISAEMCNKVTNAPLSTNNPNAVGYSLLTLAALRGETEVIAKLASQTEYFEMLTALSPLGTPVAIAIRKGIKDKAFNDIALQLLKITDETDPNDKNKAMAAYKASETGQRSYSLYYKITNSASVIDVAVTLDSDLTSTLLMYYAGMYPPQQNARTRCSQRSPPSSKVGL